MQANTKNTDPISIEINDTKRVEAALELARAINKLADVVAGQTANVAITGCTFKGIQKHPGILIKSSL
jgi:hypothetical protein